MRRVSGLQHLLAFLTELLQTCERLAGIGLGGDHRGGPGVGGREGPASWPASGASTRKRPVPRLCTIGSPSLRDDGLAEQVFRFARGRLAVGFEVKHDLGVATW